MRSVKGVVVLSVAMCLFGGALLHAEEGLGTSSLDAVPQEAATAAQEQAQPAAPETLTPVPETASAVAPAAPEVAAPAPVPAPAEASPSAVMEAVTTPAPAAVEQPAYTPAPSMPEEKKEEPKPADMPKRKEKKASKKPDLTITKVVAKPAGNGMVEVVVFIKNKGGKKAKTKEDSGGIRLAVRPEGESATRDIKVDDEVAADKVIEFSIGTYTKDEIDGKNIFVMVSYDGKEDSKSNNVWNKPAKMKKK